MNNLVVFSDLQIILWVQSIFYPRILPSQMTYKHFEDFRKFSFAFIFFYLCYLQNEIAIASASFDLLYIVFI